MDVPMKEHPGNTEEESKGFVVFELNIPVSEGATDRDHIPLFLEVKQVVLNRAHICNLLKGLSHETDFKNVDKKLQN
jgi:hypothetical protein